MRELAGETVYLNEWDRVAVLMKFLLQEILDDDLNLPMVGLGREGHTSCFIEKAKSMSDRHTIS